MFAYKTVNKSHLQAKIYKKAKAFSAEFDSERIVENLSDIMFKLILFFGVPYFLFVLFQFFTMAD